MAKWCNAVVVGLSVAVGVAWFFNAAGNAPLAQAAPGQSAVAILNTNSVWHTYTTLKPPLIDNGGVMKPVTSLYPWVDKETPLAPEGWNTVAFDDGSWLRGDAHSGPHTPYASNLYLRGEFQVADPAQAKGLKVSVAYHGGAIIYVNGQEIARANLPKDASDATAVAESYPTSVFILSNGEIVYDYWGYKGPKEALTGRQRQLTDVAIPATALHKGVNVLAIEAIRAPYDKAVSDYWDKSKRKDTRELRGPSYDLNWDTCEIDDVTLTAAGPGGVVSNVGRPNELQAWTSDVLTSDTYQERADRCQPLRPVALDAPRNGWASGKVVIGSSRAISGVKVTCPDLKRGDAVIPAAAMRARYAVAFSDRPAVDTPLESLLEKPLDSFPVIGGAAVVPIWFTVKVPADAKPGTYTGQATIQVAGEKAILAPIQLQVSDYAVPDTQDYKTWMELIESPDTLAMEYKVPMWSQKHWDLMAQSMRYIGEIGSRVVVIPLIAQTNAGNAESMVRWIPKGDGTYDYDLSIADKYLDLATRIEGKPKIVVFTAWEIYLATPAKAVTLTAKEDQQKDSDWASMEKSWSAARWDLRGKGPAVTALDPKTGEISSINLPRFENHDAAMAAWKPLFDLLHKDMAKRGLEKNMVLGMASDLYPNKEEMATLDKASGSLPWIDQGHQGPQGAPLAGGLGHVVYQAYVWPNTYPGDPRMPRTYGWKRPELYVAFHRFTAHNDWLLPTEMIDPELEITGNQRGLGRIGGDTWAVLKNKRGDREGYVWSRYRQSLWHSCNLMSHMLNPGPDGPVATAHYEALRQGMQNCEARIAIETVLTSPQKTRLGAELAGQCQKLLDDRLWQLLKGFSGLQLSGRVYTTYTDYNSVFYYNAGGEGGADWYAGSGWQNQQKQLYALAGQVQEKMGLK